MTTCAACCRACSAATVTYGTREDSDFRISHLQSRTAIMASAP